MCTAVAYQNGALYFGRNLDYEATYGEQVTILPRRFPLRLRYGPVLQQHYAMIGMAHIRDGYPLYYDGCNETGLCIAGLNFPHSAVYAAPGAGQNIAAFELIPWLLATAKDLAQAKAQLAACRRQAAGVRYDPELAQILARSESIYRQAVAHYNDTLCKPWCYLPGHLLGFDRDTGGDDL